MRFVTFLAAAASIFPLTITIAGDAVIAQELPSENHNKTDYSYSAQPSPALESLALELDTRVSPQDEREAGIALKKLTENRPTIAEAIDVWINAQPRKTIFTFSDAKSKAKDNLNELLDDSLSTLLLDTDRSQRKALKSLDQKIAESEASLATLQMEDIADVLPREADLGTVSRYNPLTRTREDLQSDIDATESLITEAKNKRADIIGNFRAQVSQLYLTEVNEKQAEALLYQANGLDLVEAAHVARVLTKIESKLKSSLDVAPKGGNTPSLRRQYYELAVISRLLIARLNERHLANYDAIYFPALQELSERHKKVRSSSRETKDRARGTRNRNAVEANLKILDNIEQVLTTYRNVLEAGKKKSELLTEASRQEADVAISTLATFNLATDLSDLGAEHFRNMAAIASLDSGVLLPLNDEEMFNQLLEVSRQFPGA